jgi:hypothetical protein
MEALLLDEALSRHVSGLTLEYHRPMSDLLLKLKHLATSHNLSVMEMAQFVMRIRTHLTQEQQEATMFGTAVGERGHPPRISVGDANPNKAGLEADMIQYLKGLAEFRVVMETLKAGHPGLLYRMAFINRVALFDAFIPDVVNTILANVPTILESKKMLTLKEFTEHTTNGTVNELIARKESTELGRGSLTDQAKWIKTYFNLHLCSKEELNSLIEFSERRNLFSHNNGVVNEIYLDKVKNSSEPLGTQLTVDFDYWYRSNKLLLDVSRGFLQSLTRKYIPGAAVPDFFLFTGHPAP